ncbi:hypothetical protein MAR_012035 [Mya arenaria]|uniref:WSC domain-containing protein n=1 Tax=Mya arenaria TaxID=6604 RepID=A0ABY7FZZ8_MYAAR|nr:hypothetical protein MAR_012035 [Mya arenaria]
MNLSGTAFMMIFVLCSEANELCTRNHTVKDQHTIIIDEACEWTVKASDKFAQLFFTATRLENDARLCDTDDSIQVKEDLTDNTVATLLNINCSTPYMVQLMFSSTAKVKVKASGADIILNMTFKEYRKQDFFISSKEEGYSQKNCHEFLDTKMQIGVRNLSVGEMLKPTEHEFLKFNHTFFESNNGTIVQGMQTCDKKCSTSDFFTFHDTVCYCLDGTLGIDTMAKYCSFPCQENLREMCGRPNYLTIYSSELCGQTFEENKGVYNFTAKPESVDVIASRSPIIIDTTQDQGQDERDRESDKEIALYIPVTVSVCVIVIVAIAIVIAICLRRKRGKKNAKVNVNEYNYSYTTTEAQTIHSFPAEQSHPECKPGEYTEVYTPQLPGNATNVSTTGHDANNQEDNTLYQQLQPTDPQESVYNDILPPSSEYGAV